MTGFLTTRSLRPWHSCIHQRKTLSLSPCSMTTASMKQNLQFVFFAPFRGQPMEAIGRAWLRSGPAIQMWIYRPCFVTATMLFFLLFIHFSALAQCKFWVFYYGLAGEKLGLGITTVAVPLEASRGHSMRAQHAYYYKVKVCLSLTLFTPFSWKIMVKRLEKGKK